MMPHAFVNHLNRSASLTEEATGAQRPSPFASRRKVCFCKRQAAMVFREERLKLHAFGVGKCK